MKIPTGFKDLDTQLGGGLEASSLVIIGGRPAMGKSAFLHDLAINFLNLEKYFVVFSLESTADQVFKRTKGRLYETFIKPCRDFEDLVAQMEILGNPDVILIDYLQLLMGYETYEAYLNSSKVINYLKRYAMENNCSVIVTSQLSRKVEERAGHRPVMTDLRDSGVIEEAADLIMFLLRREYYDAHDKPGMAELIIAKNRYGERGSINLVFRKDTLSFSDYVKIAWDDMDNEAVQKAFSPFMPA